MGLSQNVQNFVGKRSLGFIPEGLCTNPRQPFFASPIKNTGGLYGTALCFRHRQRRRDPLL